MCVGVYKVLSVCAQKRDRQTNKQNDNTAELESSCLAIMMYMYMHVHACTCMYILYAVGQFTK